jgi:hypothetical protein
MMEINLSCPNILDKPPPAYDAEALGFYVKAVEVFRREAYRASIESTGAQPEFVIHVGFSSVLDVRNAKFGRRLESKYHHTLTLASLICYSMSWNPVQRQ